MSKTLLLADDSVTIQKVVGISFANEDVVLLTVDNGDDAIARARETRPDVVLADVVMPGKNGYEVCEAIKSDPNLAGVPVLLLTGTFEPFDEERAARAGADGHITKPFEAQALVDRVNALLARQEAAPAPPAMPAAAPASPEPAAEPEAFEFFDEPRAQAPAEPQTPAEPALELDDAAEPAAFELDAPLDLGGAPEPLPEAPTAPVASPPPPPPPAAAPEPDAPAWPTPPPIPEAAPPPPPPPSADPAAWNDMTGGGPFDLGFIGSDAPGAPPALPADDDPLAQLEPEELAAEAVLDPEAAHGHEVSSSDLGDPLADLDAPTAPPHTPAPAPPSAPEPVPPSAPEPVPPPLAAEPLAFAQAEPEPMDAADDVPLAEPAPFGADDVELAAPVGLPAGGPPSAPRPEPVQTAPLPEPPAPPRSEPTPAAPTPAPGPPATEIPTRPEFTAPPATDLPMPPAPPVAEPMPAPPSTPVAEPPPAPAPEPAPQTGGAPTPFPPEWSARIQESVEKVAWEAFGDLSERIVREAVARVEAVAWEVIPQLAETLIREELRRLQDEGEDS